MLVKNSTPFVPLVSASLDLQGQLFGVFILRGTFRIVPHQPLLLDPEQAPLVKTDVFHGEPATSSLYLESDIAPFKPRSDIYRSNRLPIPSPRSARGTAPKGSGPSSAPGSRGAPAEHVRRGLAAGTLATPAARLRSRIPQLRVGKGQGSLDIASGMTESPTALPPEGTARIQGKMSNMEAYFAQPDEWFTLRGCAACASTARCRRASPSA